MDRGRSVGADMAQDIHLFAAILRRKQFQGQSGFSRSTLYNRIGEGLWTQPVRLGPRAVGWPTREVEALNGARISGKSDDEIRALVVRLHAERDASSAEPREGRR